MEEIAPNIYVSTEHPGVNVGFIVLPGGAIAVDAPTLPRDARAWRQRIMEKASGPILYVVLTDSHPDRMVSLGLLGAPIVASRAAYERALVYTEGFRRSVIEGWGRRYPEAAEELASLPPALPEIMFTHHLMLRKGGADVMVESVAGGAPGSAWVYLAEQDVLFAGDTLVVDTHPFLEAAVDTRAWLETLTALRRPRYARTIMVPGRGPVSGQEATRPLSEYLALARRRARSLQLAGCGRVDKAAAVAELLPFFPVAEEEQDLIQRRIRAGLDRLCEEAQGERSDG